MDNQVRLEGRIFGSLTRRCSKAGVLTDFLLRHVNSDFQIVAECYIEKAIVEDMIVTVCGRLVEDDGDVYIAADSVEPDQQLEMNFT